MNQSMFKQDANQSPGIGFTLRGTWLLFLFIAALGFACSGGGSSTAGSEESAAAEETAETAETAEEASDEMLLTQDDIANLMSRFEYDESSGWYTHTFWGDGWPKRRTLTADVYQNGYYQMYSNFYGQKAMNHKKVEVKIGEETIETNEVDLKSNDHTTTSAEGREFEKNRYTNGGDNKILQTIFQNQDAEVSIRFIGDKSYTEFEALSPGDKKALIECFQLSLILRQNPQ